jgi:hypothetical protein
MSSKNRNIRHFYRGINEFKRGYQSKTNLLKHENFDLFADSKIYGIGRRITFVSD